MVFNKNKRGKHAGKKNKKSFWSRRTPFQKIAIVALGGYVFGVVLTYLWFVFLSTQMGLSVNKATWISCVCGAIFTIGLAYSKNIRCIIILIIPSLCSVKGRSLLVAYAFMLACTGPIKNILFNVDVLSDSFACGQEQVKTALQGMLDTVKRPLVAIKDAVGSAMKTIKNVLKKVEKVLNRILDLIMKIINVIKKAFSWLGSIVNICNKELGTPFDRCIKMAHDAIEDCRAKLGIMKFLCEVVNVMDGMCYSVKFIDLVCLLVDYISDAIVAKVTEAMNKFKKEIRRMFYVNVKFEHDFNFKTEASKSLKDVGDDILKDIHRRTKNFFLVFGWLDLILSLLFLRIIFKAYYYKHKFLRVDRFDNKYITKQFEELDGKREEMGKDIVLPLTRKERKKYVKLSSLKLLKKEKWKLARSGIFLLISTLQLFSICFADYSIFWLLSVIRYHGRKQAGLEVPPIMTVSVRGKSFLSEIYSGIIKAFEPMAERYDIDPIPCLPNPRPPSIPRFIQIGGIMLAVWVCLVLEPYILRLRQIVMSKFYPERAHERAIWLHNQILLRRTSFVKLARRNARIKFLKDDSKRGFSCMDWLRAKTDGWWIMRKILGKGTREFCMLCGTPFLNEGEMILCPRPNCKGKYCKDCFLELNNLCFICRDPIEYGDLSDISEEKDSSDEFEGPKVDNVCSKYAKK